LGRSPGFLGSTTRTTGDTENFMTFMMCASLKVVMAPVLTRYPVLIHAHQAADVTDGLHLAAHHEDGALDGLLVEVVVLLAGPMMRAFCPVATLTN
jgi:hypothetical protein